MAVKAANLDTEPRVRELAVAAEEGQLGRVRDFIVEVCGEAGFSTRETSNTKLAVDEACTNIIKHAYKQDSEGDIRIRAEIAPGSVTISLHDRGERFDFASVKDPDLDQYVETGRKGGLGVFLINRLMDGVDYRSGEDGNRLVMVKRSQAALSSGLFPQIRPLRSTLKFKFTFRAASGLFLLIAVLGAFILVRQTNNIATQETTRWVEKRRLAGNVASRSKDALLKADEFSVEQTNLTTFLAKLMEGDEELVYVRVVNNDGEIVSSGNIDEMFTAFAPPVGQQMPSADDAVTWTRVETGAGYVRDIAFPVEATGPDQSGQVSLGVVHVGVNERALREGIRDTRLPTVLVLIAILIVGVFLIWGLVSVFVRPIQMLTDGVRAIGDGNLDGKLNVEGPAEIGAIASVFNEITDKFKVAQTSILEQEKMQKEMEVAKQIQHSLLPRWKPDVSGYDIAPLYQAAADVGGDYYDFVKVDEDTIGVVVADVSGKGVPGSLVMTMIRTALRMEARGNKNASDVMSKMNEFVTDDMKKGMFVTMFYVILDSKNRIISYASAGHNPMILYRHETNETYFLNPKGFPVGISLPDESLFRKSITLEKIKLKKDDMLLIYTDGVTEAMNEKRDQYGEERLLKTIKEHGHLPPDEFIQALELDIQKFTGDYPQNDDITVVAVKEKMTADDVLSGIRKQLLDLVEVDGLSVKEACKRMRVSPATYYRYKKRVELLGERGLKNKVLREDTELKRVSLEARKEIIEIVRGDPEMGAKRITDEYNKSRKEAHHITERMVYDELRRLNMNTKELRIDYLRRNRLLDEEDVETTAAADGREETTDEFLDVISEVDAEPEIGARTEADRSQEPPREPSPAADDLDVYEEVDGVGLKTNQSADGVAEIGVNGHLDSVTSATLEKRIRDQIKDGQLRFLVDLTDVTYISSGGWGIFTGEVKELREQGGDLVLVGMSPEVYDVYELLGFSDVLKAFETPDEAHAYFRLPAEERMEAAGTAAPPEPAEPEPVSSGDGGEISSGMTRSGSVSEWESLRIEAATVGETGDIAVISLRGIIDTVSAEALRDALGKVIAQGIYKIVVDMGQVEYVSSGGWGTFTERLREVRRADGDIKLFGMDPDVYYVFTMLGFNIVLSSFDILTEAIDDFEHAAKTQDSMDGTVTAVDDGSGATTALADDETASVEAPRDDGATEPPPAPEPSTPDRQEVGDTEIIWETTDDGVVVARMRGPLESTSVESLSDGLAARLVDRPAAILFDLTEVDYISSTGWGQFAKAYDACQAWGGTAALFGMDPQLREIYSFLEFDAFLTSYETKEQAIAGINARAEEAPGEATAPPSGPVTDAETKDLDDVLGDGGAEAPSAASEWPAPPDPAWSDAGDGGTDGGPGRADESPGDEDAGVPEVETPHVAAGGDGAGPEEADIDTLADDPAEAEREGARLQFDEIDTYGDDVDVNAAVTDKNVDNDSHLRKMGWAEYGERLRRRNQEKKKSE